MYSKTLPIRRPETEVIFDQKICSVCELCAPACLHRAMEARAIKNSYFE